MPQVDGLPKLVWAAIYYGARWLLALTFATAGVVKLVYHHDFVTAMGGFGLVADELVGVAAWGVAGAELAAGLGLAFLLPGSLAVISLLLAIFVAVLSYGVSMGLDIDCGCLGPHYTLSIRTQLWIDLFFLCCCGIVFRGRARHVSE